MLPVIFLISSTDKWEYRWLMWRVLAAVLCVFSFTCYWAEDNYTHLNGKVGAFVKGGGIWAFPDRVKGLFEEMRWKEEVFFFSSIQQMSTVKSFRYSQHRVHKLNLKWTFRSDWCCVFYPNYKDWCFEEREPSCWKRTTRSTSVETLLRRLSAPADREVPENDNCTNAKRWRRTDERYASDKILNMRAISNITRCVAGNLIFYRTLML